MKFLFIISMIAMSITVNAQAWNWKSTTETKFSLPIQAQLPPQCPTREGCSSIYSEIEAQVASFKACMASKVDVIIDDESITYDRIDIPDMGALFCWGFLHHATVVLPPMIPVDMKHADESGKCQTSSVLTGLNQSR